MRRQLALVCFALAALVLAFGAIENSSAQQKAKPAAPAAKPVEAQNAKATCLGCHGPFSDLVKKVTDYEAPSGEKISPHRYVPHDSTNDDDIPECTNCHTPHPQDAPPAQGSAHASKTSVKWCYDSCHHENNFASCKNCHS